MQNLLTELYVYIGLRKKNALRVTLWNKVLALD